MKRLVKELRQKSPAELKKREDSLRAEIGKLSLELKVSQPKNTNAIFQKRKELAVILTISHEKKELEELKKIKD